MTLNPVTPSPTFMTALETTAARALMRGEYVQRLRRLDFDDESLQACRERVELEELMEQVDPDGALWAHHEAEFRADQEGGYCGACNGSGEGMRPGTCCTACGGHGGGVL